MSDGRVEVEDLQDEQMQRGDRVELAFAPVVADLAAGIEDFLVRQERLQVLLDSLQR